MAFYAWLTDIHLDHLANEDMIVKFAEQVVASSAAGVFITGDISMAPSIVRHLAIMEGVLQRPIYFVCGNHDYYKGDVTSVRKQLKELTNMSSFLKYGPTASYFQLSPNTAVVAHDGWYDCRAGNAYTSNFFMTDWFAIADFVPTSGGRNFVQGGRVLNRPKLVELAQKLAYEGTMHVHNGIKEAVRKFSNVVVLTHFPPFAQAHVHQGQPADDNALPWYTNKQMGDMLLDAAKAFPNVKFTVLAGHTHGKAEVQVAPNMTVSVGGAEYGSPQVQRLIDLP